MFELYQLRYFLAVVETGSFTKAAARCFVTQPTLSAGIKKLEGELGTPLFQRSSRRVFLTDAGARFVGRAKSILLECNRAAREAKAGGEPSVLRIGVLRTLSSHLVARLLADFRGHQPDAILELFEGTEQELTNRMDEDGIDLAITILRGQSGANPQSLFEEDYVLALSSEHPLAGERVIEGADLASQTMIVRSRCEVLSETSRYFTDRNVRPRFVYRTEHDERALEMVAAGLGVTVCPRSFVGSGVSAAHLAGFDLTRKMGLVRAGGLSEQPQDSLAARFSAFTVSQDWSGSVTAVSHVSDSLR